MRQAEPNPVLQGVMVTGADAMPARIIQDSFDGQAGNILNFGLFGQSMRSLNSWYENQGVFGQVLANHAHPNYPEHA